MLFAKPSSLIVSVFIALVSATLACAPPPARAVTAADCADVRDEAGLAVLYRQPILKVEPIHRYRANIDHHDLEGAAIVVPTTQADSTRVERALLCHAARHEVVAFADIDAATDPVRPARGSAVVRVEWKDEEIIVRVTATDDEVAKDILARARALQSKANKS